MKYPSKQIGKLLAARDPLTPVAILRRIYAENFSDLDHSLTTNLSLPLDIVEDMITRTSSVPCYALLLSPLATFKQARDIAKKTVMSASEELEACETVIEMFDLLTNIEDPSGWKSEFLSSLLCSPLVSTDDFKKRVELHEEMLARTIIFADARYDVNSIDLDLLKKTRNFMDFDGIFRNINIAPSVLAELVAFLKSSKLDFSSAVYDNPQCPVPVSINYFLETIDDHYWSPSCLLNFEPRLDKYMGVLLGEGPWKDLPLLWKMKMVAE
jgi:hypothetical protein